MDESLFYNAVAIAKRGDRRAIEKAKGTCTGWQEAYHALREKGENLPEPEPAYEELTRTGVRIILDSDREYPQRLREIPHPPLALYIKGPPAMLVRDPMIAIVGTRRATAEGKDTAKRFARALADAGFVIVSGLAFGIDAAAHEGCLAAETGEPAAIAVLAGGLRSLYPRNNENLGRKILARGGAMLSEYPMGEGPLPRRFVERNRIVSGLARGALVIEAPEASGALSTARFAFEQNRDVFVVPGNITQPNFRGSNRLIQQGAALVTAPKDIFETYGIVMEGHAGMMARERAALSPEETLIVDALARADHPLDVDKIIIMTRLEPRIVNRAISFLIIGDIVKEEGGGYVVVRH